MADKLLRETKPGPGYLPEIIPGQYWDEGVGGYEKIQGSGGAPRVLLWGPDGSALMTAEDPGYVDVVDRAGRKLGIVSSGIEQTNGLDTAGKSGLVAGKSPTGKQIPLSVREDGTLNVGSITLEATNVGITSNITTVNSAPVTGTKTITATAAELFAGASAKANRRYLKVKSEDPVLRMRIGGLSVSQQNGDPIEPGGTVIVHFDPAIAVPIYGISEGASLKVSVMEV